MAPHLQYMLFSVTWFLSSANAVAPCYRADNLQVADVVYTPCNTMASVSMCFRSGSDTNIPQIPDAKCLPNGLALSEAGSFWREPCTDPTWNSPYCLQAFDSCSSDQNGGAFVTACDSPAETSTRWCCGGNSSCCDTNAIVIAATLGPVSVTSSTTTPPSSTLITSTAPGTSSSSTATSSTSDSSSTGSSSSTSGSGTSIPSTSRSSTSSSSTSSTKSPSSDPQVTSSNTQTTVLPTTTNPVIASSSSSNELSAGAKAAIGISAAGLSVVTLLGVLWFVARNRRPAMVKPDEFDSDMRGMGSMRVKHELMENNPRENTMLSHEMDTMGLKQYFVRNNFQDTPHELDSRGKKYGHNRNTTWGGELPAAS